MPVAISENVTKSVAYFSAVRVNSSRLSTASAECQHSFCLRECHECLFLSLSASLSLLRNCQLPDEFSARLSPLACANFFFFPCLKLYLSFTYIYTTESRLLSLGLRFSCCLLASYCIHMNIVNWFLCSFSQSLYLYRFRYLYLFNLMFIFSTRTAGVCPSDTLLNIAQQMLSLASSSATKQNVIFKLKSFCLHKYVIHSHMNERTHTHATAPLSTHQHIHTDTHTVGRPTAAPVTKASKQTATRTTKHLQMCIFSWPQFVRWCFIPFFFTNFSFPSHHTHTHIYRHMHTHVASPFVLFFFFC